MKGPGLALALALALAATASARADVLLLDSISSAPPNNAAGVPRPHRGSSMNIVKGQYGEPTAAKPAVGDPPITRWVYPTFTVYFESEHVIDVVVHR